MKTIISQITSHEALLKGEDALKIGYPQLTAGAIIALESMVNKQTKVLELGCGGSTLFWAKNCKSVKSYETDVQLYKSVKQKTRFSMNVDLLLLTRHGVTQGLKSEPNNGYDIVLVNSDPARTKRLDLANSALPKIKPGGWIIINNYARFGMAAFNYSKKPVLTFDQLGFPGLGTKFVQRT